MTWAELEQIGNRISLDKGFKTKTELFKAAKVDRPYNSTRMSNSADKEVDENMHKKWHNAFPEYVPVFIKQTKKTKDTDFMEDKEPPPPIETTESETLTMQTLQQLLRDSSILVNTNHILAVNNQTLVNVNYEQTLLIKGLINKDSESRPSKEIEDITTRLLSLQDVLLQVGTGRLYEDSNELLRDIGKGDLEHLPPHRKRKRTDIRTTDM